MQNTLEVNAVNLTFKKRGRLVQDLATQLFGTFLGFKLYTFEIYKFDILFSIFHLIFVKLVVLCYECNLVSVTEMK